MQAAGTEELWECPHSQAPRLVGNPVNSVLSHLPDFTSSMSNVKTSQTRIFLQWCMFFRNLAIT